MTKSQRTSTRLSKKADDKLNRIQGRVLAKFGKRVTRDDIIDHLVLGAPESGVVLEMAFAKEGK